MGILRIFLYLLVILVVLFSAFLAYFTLTDYKPGKQEVLAEKENPDVIGKDSLSLLIWNIGYAGLGDDMSFFYDGGSRVRSSEKRVDVNMAGILEQLSVHRDVDVFLLQEVDVASKRSYHTDQFRQIHDSLPAFHGYFALNYRVQFIPIPPGSPMGKVTSGLAAFTSYLPEEVMRYDLPGSYSWPKSLFMLDRCFMVLRFPLKNGRELVLINTHHSAYDQGGLKKKEMDYLREFLLSEYEKGHYLVAGGDWNQNPPGIESAQDRYSGLDTDRTRTIPADFMPEGWTWAFDASTPTNRSLKAPYHEGTETAVIDYYLLSPNISLNQVETIDLKFRNADHQPVMVRVSLD